MINLHSKIWGGGDNEKPHYNLGNNPSFCDISGYLHRFFRPYIHLTLECYVRILPFGYCYSNDEIIFTKNKKVVISHTPLRIHPFVMIYDGNKFKYIKESLRLLKKQIKFYIKTIFTQTSQNSIALLSRQVSNNYGHFITETIAGLYQLKLANIEPDYYILPLDTPFQTQMYEILGINKERIIPSYPSRLIHAKKLIVPTPIADYEIVEYRPGYTHFRSFVLPYFVYTMYDKLCPHLLNTTSTKPKRKLFLTRPINSNRNILNLQEIESILTEYGFEIILPDNLSVSEQIATISSATHIIGMHGAGLDNLIFAEKDTKMLEIFSQYYHDASPQMKALARGLKYYYIVGSTPNISIHPQQECVYLCPKKLRMALKKFL
ncbi:glycosyltransferase family 61 protein [Helicobacter sp. MIT 21-1697]|uniref:glycosyltransferase family 61 protein n=1 Tax=Helicobacter sp. MIT 21-1697 TaxID=2993733 RepID=UPI00224B9626|nr:glycosyltransferase family 61 protein [Helicobacter sp. MIT 21-1697]MCX2716539.1 glycosyltransferase family 61 protein [Helicobacter sp. MIT 21-1697]